MSDEPNPSPKKVHPANDQTKHAESIDSKSTRDKAILARQWLGGISMLGVWGMLIYQLQTTWNLNDQYAHGYLVPILCLFLAVKAQGQEEDLEDQDPKNGKAWLYVGVPCILFLCPLWIVREANSDWRLLNVALFACALLFSFALLYDRSGLKNVKLLAFPLLFFAVAIPWPLAMDLQLTQWLQGRVSSLIVDFLLLMGHEVRLQGNVIDVGVFGQVGVDEACSGIHGLQASLVVTLFLGAYYRLGIVRRIVFCIAGTIVALALNLARAFCLSYFQVKGKGNLLHEPLFSLFGTEAPSLHDMAGWIESGAILVLLVLLGRLNRYSSRQATASDQLTNWQNLRTTPPLIAGSLFCLSLPLVVYLTEWHYKKNERNLVSLPHLVASFKGKQITTFEKTISTSVEAQLHYVEAQSAEWQDNARTITNPFDATLNINRESEYWQGFQCSWISGGACTAVLSTHSPDACLPLTGLVQVAPPPGKKPKIILVNLESHNIPFEAYEFSQGRKNLHVFRCFWPLKKSKGETPGFPSSGYDFNGRIKAAIEGRRNVGGTMLALCISNIASHQEAIAKLHREARERLSFALDDS